MSTSINDLNISGLKFYTPAAPTATDGTSTAALQNDFLKLLTTQLRNQDPLNPLESAEMTSQLAQLNMVDGINNMNKSMASLVSQIQMSDFMNQASTIGRSALVNGATLQFNGMDPVALGAVFSKPVTDAEVKITDMSGNIVMQSSLGTVNTQIQNLMWDGMGRDGQAVAPGNYRIEVTGKDGQSNVAAQTMVASMVAAVGRDGSNINMTLADGRKIAPADVVQWVYQ